MPLRVWMIEQIVKELHVELVVFDDHDGLAHRIAFARRKPSGTLVFCPKLGVTSMRYES
jgi:hypothetical protein